MLLSYVHTAISDTLTNQGLGYGSDVWMAFVSVHNSVNCLKSGHGSEIKNCGLCPAGIL